VVGEPEIVGASLTGVTVTVIVSESVSAGSPLSVTDIVKFSVPWKFWSGVNVSWVPEIEAVILVPKVTENVCVSAESTSVTAKLSVRLVSSLVDRIAFVLLD